MLAQYIPTDPRILHAMKIMKNLPPEAIDYVIRDLDKTTEFVKTLTENSNKKSG